jgi:hypothetical protein
VVVPIWPISGVNPPLSRAAAVAALLLVILPALSLPSLLPPSPHTPGLEMFFASSSTPVGNFSQSINRLVELVALAGSGILALVWARVALSWFSNDVTKKVQAKDRARDALIGTLLFMAAVTGLLYGLAHWVLTGS